MSHSSLIYILDSSPKNRALCRINESGNEPILELEHVPILNMIEVIDIDNMADEPTPKESSTPSQHAACNGYVFNFPDGQNPHTAYPFALHNSRSIPWDYSV